TERLGGRISTRTDEISNLKPTGDARQDQKAAKTIIEKVAAEMQRYSHILDQVIPDARREFSSALRCMQHAVIISNQDGMSSADDVKGLVGVLESLQATLSNVHGQVSNFQNAISSTPRMTSKLNQAKRRTIKSVSDLLNFLSESSINIDTTLTAIQH
ncbi:MAG: hypothetical protein KAT26_10175, partial [Marinosulfonomonas sp.]|nr:hypothetical protein [Marinosulfonomonas sp.]